MRTFLLLFLQISVYFAVLLCLLPLLRRFISARACAVLWLLPNLLYVTFDLNIMTETKPRFFITLPDPRVQKAFVIIWLVGFGTVLLWQVISHLRFRRRLLKNGETVTDSAVLACRDRERWRGNLHRDIPLVWSDEVKTPVTVGCFLSTVVLALPRREYTQEELTLIFRHEFRHMKRADMRTKVFLAFCTAICWFDPLMWVARKKASEDLELSCDEEVLKEADEATRRQYAELLLQTAGDSRGFSTCLSAGASSLRYRLKNVVAPRKKWAGAVGIVLAILVLFMSTGTVAFAERITTVGESIFSRYSAGGEIKEMSATDVSPQRSGWRRVYGWQEKELLDYLGSLKVRRVYSDGYDGGSGDERELQVIFERGSWDSLTYLTLWDGLLWANLPNDGEGELPYLVEDEVDWDYVVSLLDFNAKAPDPVLDWPRWMQAGFRGGSLDEELCLSLSGVIQEGSHEGERIDVEKYYEGDGPSGLYGYESIAEARLIFPYPPEKYEVLVENWDRTDSYTLSDADLEGDVLLLAPYSAHYTIRGQFSPQTGTFFEVAFSFDIEFAEG